jgi:hypothetical protein
MSSHQATFGVYQNKFEVKKAVQALKNVGFKTEEITVLNPNQPLASNLPQGSGNQISAGILLGGVLGVTSAFVLVVVGAMLPSVRDLYTSVYFPIFGILLGGALGAASGALVGIGIPLSVSRRYSEYLTAGGILLSVQTDGPETSERAYQIFETTGAQDIKSMSDHRI